MSQLGTVFGKLQSVLNQDKDGLTATITGNTIDCIVRTSLIHAFFAPSADTIMASMPRSANPIADLPRLHAWTYSDNITNGFMTGDQRPGY